MSNPVQPLTPAQTALVEAQVAQEGYLRRLPVAIDIFVDELTGSPMDMTISTRWGLWALRGKGVKKFVGTWGCRFLNKFEKNHDAGAAAGDDQRATHLRELLKMSGIIS